MSAPHRESTHFVRTLDALLDSSDLAVSFYDRDLRLVYSNHALPAAGRVPRGALIGRTLDESLPMLSLAITPALTEVRDSGLPLHERHFHDGARIWRMSYYPVRGADDAMLGVGAIGTEDTTRLRVHQLLLRSEQRYRSLVATCPDAIVEIEREHITLANQAAIDLVGGAHARSLIGRSIWGFVFPEDLRAARDAYASAVARGTTAPFEARLRRIDGKAVLVDVRSVLYDPSRPGLAQAVLRDVTEERRDADVLRLAHDDLERRVAGRTASLAAAYDRLRDQAAERERTQARLAASERLASIGTFAAGMAHEINNPLAAILASAELARALAAEPASRDQLDAVLGRIIADARRAGDVVKRLLAFPREPSPSRRPVEFNGVVRQVCEGLAGRTPLDVRLGRRVPAVSMSAVELEQVVVNLVENARQARATRVRVTTSTEDGHAVLRVEDDGVGIPANHRERIFEPFFTTRQHAGGTGLGLSVVHGVVTLYGGTIQVRSIEGRGSAFTVTVPAGPAEGQALAASR